MAGGPGPFQRPSLGVFEAPVEPGRRAPAPKVRRFHVSAAAVLLLGIPWLAFSLTIILIVYSAVRETTYDPREYFTGLFIAFGIFLLSGGLAFVRPVERAIAKVLFRLRRPDGNEATILYPTWESVATSAGVAPDKYELWVQNSNRLNAFATAGHTVAVTTTALKLPGNHLAAVLGHELGHHLGGHSWAKSLTFWYSIPARIFVRVWSLVTRLIFDFLEFFIGRFAWVLWALWMCVVIALLWDLGHPLLPAAFLMPFVLAWFNRLGEKHADRVAADIGFGQPLIALLYESSGDDHHADVTRWGWWARLLTAHPSGESRIRALEKRVNGGGRTGR